MDLEKDGDHPNGFAGRTDPEAGGGRDRCFLLELPGEVLSQIASSVEPLCDLASS
jgi:hypothetical protein